MGGLFSGSSSRRIGGWAYQEAQKAKADSQAMLDQGRTDALGSIAEGRTQGLTSIGQGYAAARPEYESAIARFTESAGITVDIPTAALTISPGVDYRLAVGSYQHGLRKRDLATDQVEQIFDGTVTVSEGNF